MRAKETGSSCQIWFIEVPMLHRALGEIQHRSATEICADGRQQLKQLAEKLRCMRW